MNLKVIFIRLKLFIYKVSYGTRCILIILLGVNILHLRFIITLWTFPFLSCEKESIYSNAEKEFVQTMNDAHVFYQWLIEESKSYYDDGTGHFGQISYGYRNVLNECYLRFDAYQLLSETTITNREWLEKVVEEMLNYYLLVADTTGEYVWGFPTETNHPEFGIQIATEIKAGNSKNGWIYALSGTTGSKAGIYYSHGQVLADLSKCFLRTQNEKLIPYIEKGAQIIVESDYNRGNVNYFAAALKGLAYAYAVLQTDAIKEKAHQLLDGILNQQNANGSFGGEHDQEAGYHGITTSCLACARLNLPAEDFPDNFDEKLLKAQSYLCNLKDLDIEERSGFVVQAWYYLYALSKKNNIPAFTNEHWHNYQKALQTCINKKDEILQYNKHNNYYYQKGIQSLSLIGSSVFQFYYTPTKIFIE